MSAIFCVGFLNLDNKASDKKEKEEEEKKTKEKEKLDLYRNPDLPIPGD